MFSMRQALSFGTRLMCTQYTMYHRWTPIICKSNGIGAFYHNRLTHKDASNRKELGKLEGKMKLMFTCTKCNTRNSKLISKLAYNKGVIIVRCDGCKNNHLIADNLGWFPEISRKINIEKLMALKGETVQKVMNDTEGYFEAVVNEEFKLHQKNTSEIKDLNSKCSDEIAKLEISKKT